MFLSIVELHLKPAKLLCTGSSQAHQCIEIAIRIMLLELVKILSPSVISLCCLVRERG